MNGANGTDCLADGSFCLPPVQDFDIQPQDVVLHPQYRELRNYPNDIAIIRLPRRAVLNAGVQIACLPPDLLVIANTQVVGWGWDNGDPSSRELVRVKDDVVPNEKQQKLSVEVLSASECFQQLEVIATFGDNLICAAGEIGSGSCDVRNNVLQCL